MAVRGGGGGIGGWLGGGGTALVKPWHGEGRCRQQVLLASEVAVGPMLDHKYVENRTPAARKSSGSLSLKFCSESVAKRGGAAACRHFRQLYFQELL